MYIQNCVCMGARVNQLFDWNIRYGAVYVIIHRIVCIKLWMSLLIGHRLSENWNCACFNFFFFNFMWIFFIKANITGALSTLSHWNSMWSAALCTLGVTKPIWGCTCSNFRQGLALVCEKFAIDTLKSWCYLLVPT